MRTGFLNKISALNTLTPQAYVPFFAAGREIGMIRRDNLPLLEGYAALGFPKPDSQRVVLDPDLSTESGRTHAISDIVADINARAPSCFAFPATGELFPAVGAWGESPVFRIERNATIFFGLRIFGLHINGLTVRDGCPHMWIARRGKTLHAWPDLLDQMVAGGQPAGLSVQENLFKEGGEEAGLPESLLCRARAAGLVSYAQDNKDGARRDTIFVFDLDMPPDVQPVADGHEVGSFSCMAYADVIALVRDTESFKPNCALVIIDYMIRSGLLTPDTDTDYARLCAGLRMGACGLTGQSMSLE